MNCNIDLHENLIESGDIVCSSCDFQLTYVKQKPLRYDCCESPEIINDNLMLVCRSCGIVQGYDSSTEYVDFYENRHKMKRKSIYYRKYHINNVLTDLCSKYRITFSVEQKNKIMRIFSVIGKILPQINGERKRMISVNFILAKILKMMKLPHSYVKVTKSKKNYNNLSTILD